MLSRVSSKSYTSGQYVQKACAGVYIPDTLRFRIRQNFVSDSEFCFRGCKDGPNAPALCQHIYDEMGCDWNMPGNYDTGFDQCDGDSGEVCPKLRTKTLHS